MSYQLFLNKILKKGKKVVVSAETGLLDELYYHIAAKYKETNARELYFLCLYYGIQTKSLTLEAIGKSQEQPLTRERVRQIINAGIKGLKIDKENLYKKVGEIVSTKIRSCESSFIRMDDLVNDEYFSDFKNNTKGLIAFLNDCGIKQISYRKKYYLYLNSVDRERIILEIQKENKTIRRDKTVEKMQTKAKTVTYVPSAVRHHLIAFSNNNDINLNTLYEEILNTFISDSPFMKDNGFVFEKTKSWRARKGKAQWEQIGIYIDKDIFEKVRSTLKVMKKELNKNISIMSFICRSFVWHYEKNGTK